MSNVSQLSDASAVPRVAVVGTGPSGMYSVEHLLMEMSGSVEIDLYERLPTPWGMVRSAVAPDHLVKKQIIDTSFARLLNHKNVRFFGNVCVGAHVSHAELADWYDAVVYASGAQGDTRMGIPGEDLPGCVGARDFVHWYNGHPDFSNLDFDLSHKRAVIIGNGNVALDVARILTLKPDELAHSDMPEYAIEALRKSSVEEVVIVGRRGQAQGAFHRPELEEFEHLHDVQVSIAGEDLVTSASDGFADLGWHTRKKLETLERLVQQPVKNSRKRIVLYFLASPEEVLGDAKAVSLRLSRNQVLPDDSGRLRATTTGETFELETGLIMRAIGFRGQPIEGLPFDADRNVLQNLSGRVTQGGKGDGEETTVAGLYVTGWLKRGPRGLIGTNRKCALETVQHLVEDLSRSSLQPAKINAEQVVDIVQQRQPQLVQREQWWVIDRFEREAVPGRPRAKLTNSADLLACALG